jgi:hypothetical protein
VGVKSHLIDRKKNPLKSITSVKQAKVVNYAHKLFIKPQFKLKPLILGDKLQKKNGNIMHFVLEMRFLRKVKSNLH